MTNDVAEVDHEGVWARVEIFGHRRHYGRISEVMMLEAPMLRVDVPQPDGTFISHVYAGNAIFSICRMSEDLARDLALGPLPRIGREDAHDDCATLTAEVSDEG